MSKKPTWMSMLPGDIGDLLSPVSSWVDGEPDAMFPSFQLGGDGPYLHSVFCLYGDLLCEVRLKTAPSAEFDFVRASPLLNLRVTLDTVTVGPEEDQKTFRTAKVALHHFGEGFTSSLEYVGTELDAWLEPIRATFGVDSVALPTK